MKPLREVAAYPRYHQLSVNPIMLNKIPPAKLRYIESQLYGLHDNALYCRKLNPMNLKIMDNCKEETLELSDKLCENLILLG